MWLVKIYVTLKKGLLDAQGKATQNALESLGFKEVEEVRIGKYINIEMKGQNQQMVIQRVEEMGKKLLANPVIEDFNYEVEVLK
ncbi:MAG: phosphoribosylformylglycinamidine synthase subunit PurS [Actinobacteria bacterium]|jgi:phosphoribosylformylglycinamidine synthase|nr:phosphoribosylformylglycinamidine synthase subunit PurS [Candidatus Atribacteria bacterium]MBE3113445.1 phosphoribosylformylglycinamidine synthase subunit PurS [Actinomycetota bacterium]MBE3126686.1 phosphoribosylformylglycinamidine synthase subunit PurS [Candidatus Atribacteria bacterium]